MVATRLLSLLLTFALSASSASASKFAYDECINKLSVMGHDMTKEDYAQLLTNLSQGQIEPSYNKLPLQLVSVFSFHACNSGRPCLRNAKATISTSTEGDYIQACSKIEYNLRALDMISEQDCGDKNDTACRPPRTIIRIAWYFSVPIETQVHDTGGDVLGSIKVAHRLNEQ